MRGLLAVTVLLAGCGPGLSSDFKGCWAGARTVEVEGVAWDVFGTRLEVSPSGTSLSVRGLCPDGTGPVDLDGIGESADWAGSLTCEKVDFGGCPEVVFRLTSAHAELQHDYGDGWLMVEAKGTGEGCDLVRPAVLRFNGKKR